MPNSRRKRNALFCIKLTIILLIWLLINIADGVWIYFYIHASIYPNPRTIPNATNSGWGAYSAMMFIFGFVWGLFNLRVCLGFLGLLQEYLSQKATFTGFILSPIAAVLILGPFFSPWIARPLAQNAAWNHGCDKYAIQIILKANASNGVIYQPSIASYFQGNTALYSYEMLQSSADLWSFGIRSIDSPDLAQNQTASLYPSISNITYNFTDDSVSGNCSSSPSNVTTTTCIEGFFNPNNSLSFNLTDLRTNTTTELRAVDKQWTFTDYAPSVVLRDSDSGTEVIRTDVTKKNDCTQLKVCAVQNNGADIVVPIGLIFIQQMGYASYCTDLQGTGSTTTGGQTNTPLAGVPDTSGGSIPAGAGGGGDDAGDDDDGDSSDGGSEGGDDGGGE
ncbi:hypothetical protein PILCRDRAFT_820243 [Piloderma croceum F 1598]|uniref:Uncharacterized protein n=1 Tax=Piloderma croceum (strain F 1598) TaxID=765440 RepID=A0A0C3FRM8_PILCF|nr:hypothetical protein PILCRDRAFT_820243 [Piloderma croceum F 1598]